MSAALGRPEQANAPPGGSKDASAPRMGETSSPCPLSELSLTVATSMHTVFSDIDDTITTDGQLTPQAYAAMDNMRRAGLRVILITGRPAGWCDHIARMWPVDAVIGENGAFYYWHDHAARKLKSRHLLTEAERAANTSKLVAVREQILREVPGCAVASDQFCRQYDLAIDFCEDVAPLPISAVERIVALMEQAGMSAKVSSIHVNGWFGDYDKLSMAHLLMRERYTLELAQERERCMFVGDSPNDAPMFAYLPHAVGVANVADFAQRMPALPAYITPSRGGAGFAELAQALISARNQKACGTDLSHTQWASSVLNSKRDVGSPPCGTDL